MGYFDARLQYDEVGMAEADVQFLKSAVARRDIELLYDQFDAHDTGWVHRLLFSPYHEVSVRFAVINLQVFPAAGRFDGGAA